MQTINNTNPILVRRSISTFSLADYSLNNGNFVPSPTKSLELVAIAISLEQKQFFSIELASEITENFAAVSSVHPSIGVVLDVLRHEVDRSVSEDKLSPSCMEAER